MTPEHAALLAELERWHAQLSSQRPLRLPHGKGWRVEQIGRRTIFTAPNGIAYTPCENGAEPDVIIEWRGQRMILPSLKLRVFDAELARKRHARKQQAQTRQLFVRRVSKRKRGTT